MKHILLHDSSLHSSCSRP